MDLNYLPQNLFWGNKNQVTVYFSFTKCGYLDSRLHMPFKIPSLKLVVCHGEVDGTLHIDKPERYNNTEYQFLCCYPKMASRKYPEIDFLFSAFPCITTHWFLEDKMFFGAIFQDLDDAKYYIGVYKREGISDIFQKILCKNADSELLRSA